MISPHDPHRDELAHANAMQRLDVALHDQRRLSAEINEASDGERSTARSQLANVNEEVAARKAWLGYLEHGR